MRLLPPRINISTRPFNTQKLLKPNHELLKKRPRISIHIRKRTPRIEDLPRIPRITLISTIPETRIPNLDDAGPRRRTARQHTRRVEDVAERDGIVERDGTSRGTVGEDPLHSAGVAHRAACVAADGDVEPVV